jgi:hypothetical protein
MLEMFALFEFEVIGLAPSIHNRLTLFGLVLLNVSSDWRKCGCRSHDSQSQAANQSISGIVGILHANCLILCSTLNETPDMLLMIVIRMTGNNSRMCLTELSPVTGGQK